MIRKSIGLELHQGALRMGVQVPYCSRINLTDNKKGTWLLWAQQNMCLPLLHKDNPGKKLSRRVGWGSRGG